MAKDFKIPIRVKIGSAYGEVPNPNAKADQPPVATDESGYARQINNTEDLGVDRNRSMDPDQFRGRQGSGMLDIYRGPVGPGKDTPVRAGQEILTPDAAGPVSIQAPVAGIGNNANPTQKRNIKSGVKSLGGRLMDGEEARVHGE